MGRCAFYAQNFRDLSRFKHPRPHKLKTTEAETTSPSALSIGVSKQQLAWAHVTAMPVYQAFTSSTLGTQHPIGYTVGRQSSPSRRTPVSSERRPYANLATSSFYGKVSHFPSPATGCVARTSSPETLRRREQQWTATKDLHYTREDVWHMAGPRTPTIGRPWLESRSTDIALACMKPYGTNAPFARPLSRMSSPARAHENWDGLGWTMAWSSSLDLKPVQYDRQPKPPLPKSAIQPGSVRHRAIRTPFGSWRHP